MSQFLIMNERGFYPLMSRNMKLRRKMRSAKSGKQSQDWKSVKLVNFLIRKYVARVRGVYGFPNLHRFTLARSVTRVPFLTNPQRFVKNRFFPLLLPKLDHIESVLEETNWGKRDWNHHFSAEIYHLWLTLCSYISSVVMFDTRLIQRNSIRSCYCLTASFDPGEEKSK